MYCRPPCSSHTTFTKSCVVLAALYADLDVVFHYTYLLNLCIMYEYDIIHALSLDDDTAAALAE